jgi:hypothetical protein
LRYINPVGETIYKNFTNFDALLTDVYAAIGFSYDKSVAIVHDRVNWNRCKAYNGSDYTCSYNKNFKQWDIDGFLPFAKVKNIINAYTNLSLRKENPLPEYVPAFTSRFLSLRHACSRSWRGLSSWHSSGMRRRKNSFMKCRNQRPEVYI